MSNLYSIGQMNEFADVFETVGGTPDLLKKLSSKSVATKVVGVCA